MATANELQHRTIRNTALPYDSFGSPVRPDPVLIAGSNVLTSKRTFIERRPGFAAYEPTPTTFPGKINRIFVWHRWDGTFFVMLSALNGSVTSVWKLKVGTDASFVSIVSAGSPTAFDFVVSDNFLFFSAVNAAAYRWDGSADPVLLWGIAFPTTAPTTSVAGTGITAVTGWTYVWTNGLSTSGEISSPSLVSLSTGVVSNKTVTVTDNGSVST